MRALSIAKASRFGAALLGSAALSGCTGPLADITSLSPAIEGSAVSNETAFADASDQILLTNILRAKDRAPLNMGALASMSGALSLSGTSGFTIPFHPGIGSGASQNSWAPSITGSTSPTYTFAPLNTQGFTLNAIQPISASYVLNRWDAGISRELLLLLFVKEIDFPVSRPADDITKADVVHFIKFVNDPDNPDRFQAFKSLVETLVRNKANMKSFDVLDPVGPKFDLYSPSNVAGAKDQASLTAATDSLLTAQPNSTGFGFITGSADGQYHVGNAIPDVGNKPKNADANEKKPIQGQLYRVYANQVALCVDAKNLGSNFPIPGPNPEVNAEKGDKADNAEIETPTALLVQHNATMMVEAQIAAPTFFGAPFGGGGGGGSSGGSSGSSGGGGGKTTGGGSGGGASGGTSSQATTQALQAQRFSSIVDEDGCGPAQIVLHRSTEKQFAEKSEKFVHIEWRSLSEVFEYLGAILRYTPRPDADPTKTWKEKAASWVATCDQNAGDFSGAAGATAGKSCASSKSDITYSLFNLKEGSEAHLGVYYRGARYAVADSTNDAADQSMIVLSMLSTLVDLANASSSVTTSAPLQLLPVP